MKNLRTALILCACCLGLTATKFAAADFVCMVVEEKTDADTADLCGAANGPDVPFPLTVLNVSIQFGDDNDRLLSVGFSDVQVLNGGDPDVFYHHPFGGSVGAPYGCTLLVPFPDLICDSYYAIGEKCVGLGGATKDGDYIDDEFQNNGHLVGGWFNNNPVNGQGDAFNDMNPDGKILILQLAMAEGLTVEGTLDVFWQNSDDDEVFQVFGLDVGAAGAECAGGCGPDGDPCDDDNPCTEDDMCSDNVCGGTPVDCSAQGDECNAASCNPDGAPGNCDDATPLAKGTACGDPSDGDCDNPDTCDGAGACQDNYEDAGTGCTDDGNDCTDDVCDGSGGCTHPNEASGTACGDSSDGDCDNPDTCDGAGACQDNNEDAGTGCPDDGNDCTDDVCDGSGSCTHPNEDVGTACGDPGDTECDDPDTCDGAGTCEGNLKPKGFPCGDPSDTLCDDPDTCDGAGTCVDNLEPSGTACGDPGDTECDDPDTCDGAGTCQDNYESSGTPCGDASDTPCDDPDTCDGAGTCQDNGAPDGTPCDDSDACSVNDECSGGECGGSKKNCDDGNECTDDGCDSGTGCTHENNSNGCNDGDDCTDPDVCSDGTCSGEPMDCPMGEICVDGECVDAGCENPGDPCDDGDDCTENDTCDAALVCLGSKVDCDDLNPCTEDSCLADGGCQHADNDDAECDDGDFCTDDACSGGECVSEPVVCDPGFVCDPANGECIEAAECQNEGDSCDDGNLCTENDTCNASLDCEGGPPVDCPEDGNPCTNASCDPLAGCGQTPNSDTCNDGDACTEDDTCADGECVGEPMDCPLGTACEDGVCVEITDVELHFDMKPKECPNKVRTNTSQAVWAALLGTDDFDITQVRKVGILLRRADNVGQALAPKNLKFKDEGTPFTGDLCDCWAVGKDQITDLRMKFKADAMVEAFELDGLPSGSVVELIVTGTLLDATPFFGRDCILIMR